MEFYVNNEKIEVKLEAEKTVGDVLTSFAKECDENKAAVIGITVNGKQITADLFDEASKEELTADTKFEFDIITEYSVQESFLKLSEVFDILADEIEAVPTLYINGKGQEANDSIKKLADSIDQFCHIATLASLFPETFTNTKIEDKTFNEFFKDFSPILNDFQDALQNNDTVLVGDLCEYEICPRLKEIASALKKLN